MKTIEQIVAEQRAIVDAAEGRLLSDEERSAYEGLEAELNATRQTEEIRARQAAYEAPNASLQAAVHVAPAKADDTEMRAFSDYLRTGKANSDLETRAQTVGSAAGGGYSVPAPMLNRIETRLKAFGGLANEVETLDTDSGETYRFPNNDDTANKAVIVGENTAPASGGADLTLGQVTVGAYTWTTSGTGQEPIAVTFQLLQDSNLDIASYVADRIAERFARGQADFWVNGTGTNQPKGITTGTTTSTFTAATIDKDELIAALHDVDPAYRASAVWVFNDATLEAIRKLEDSTGRPLWTPAASAGLEGSIGGTLLGHRVVIDQSFATYTDGGTNKWGVFGDVRTGYLIRRVRGMRLIVDEVTGKNEGRVEYAAHVRADGTVKQPHAYTVLQNAA
ncbi:phage major capsid protein [Mycobacterium sp. MBM]|nr:phage major capsid protein [Mycobacterium sp. MBM]